MLIADHSFSSLRLGVDSARSRAMTMEASSNSRDGPSSTASLQLSVEQWELLRRLRNSHLTKAQIIRAYDELDRLDRELGHLFNTASIAPSLDPGSPSAMNTQQISPSSVSLNNNNNNKRPHSHSVNGIISRSSTTSNGYYHTTASPTVSVRSRNGGNELNSTLINQQYETLNATDVEEETRELQELLAYVDTLG